MGINSHIGWISILVLRLSRYLKKMKNAGAQACSECLHFLLICLIGVRNGLLNLPQPLL